MQIKVAITDNHLPVINGIKTMLAPYAHISVVYVTTDPGQLLSGLTANLPHVLLMEIHMPGTDGITLYKQVHKALPHVKVIGISSLIETHYVKQLLRNGAAGCLLKNTEPATLAAAIEKVHAGEQFLDEPLKQKLLDEVLSGRKKSSHEVPLTKREKEILKLIAEEHSNQEIADMLYISLRTVETHRLNLTQKLAVRNTAGLVKEAIRRGLLD